MVIELKKLFETVGEKLPLNFDLDLSHTVHSSSRTFRGPVHIEGAVENRAGIVTLGYLATFTLSTLCDRCLAPIERPFSMRFEHTVVDKLYNTEENDELILCEEDGTLDLGELIKDDILLELPIKMLCREDCKGLCPVCGANLNETTCDCQRKQIDPRLAVLKKLLEEN